MSHPKKESQQIALSREWIFKALLRLMEEKDFTEITITEICKTAGVGRQTFYRRFSGKEDIIRYELERGFSQYLESLFKRYGSAPSPREIIVEGFCHWKQNERVHRLLIKQNMDSIFITSLEQHYQFFKDNNLIRSDWGPYLPEFAIGGTLSVLLAWIKNGMQESPDEMGDVVSGFFNPQNLWN